MGPRIRESADDAPPDLELGVRALKGAPGSPDDANTPDSTTTLPFVPITLKVSIMHTLRNLMVSVFLAAISVNDKQFMDSFLHP